MFQNLPSGKWSGTKLHGYNRLLIGVLGALALALCVWSVFLYFHGHRPHNILVMALEPTALFAMGSYLLLVTAAGYWNPNYKPPSTQARPPTPRTLGVWCQLGCDRLAA